jgi:hypothetical protein
LELNENERCEQVVASLNFNAYRFDDECVNVASTILVFFMFCPLNTFLNYSNAYLQENEFISKEFARIVLEKKYRWHQEFPRQLYEISPM